MTMTVSQMIEVLQAYKRGEKIEYQAKLSDEWRPCAAPMWNFYDLKYRIAKPEPKKIKMLCWLCPAGELRWVKSTETWSNQLPWLRVPAEDRVIEVEE